MTLFPQTKIGILGGGQLARLLCLKAHNLGLSPHVLSLNKEDPAAQVTSSFKKGSLSKKKDVLEFLKTVDVATFESEFVPSSVLRHILQQTITPIYPHPSLMALLADRLTQKQLLQQFCIPTSPFIIINNLNDVTNAFQQLSPPLVFKKRHGGYDGYGTYILQSQKEAHVLHDALKKNPLGFIAEEFIPFKRELAFIAIRNLSGDIAFLPLVESHQKHSRCFWVKGPIDDPRLKSFKIKLTKMLHSIEYVGAIGIELFDHSHTLYVNELAPRVHNTGHYSLDALNFDQFTLHLLALFNQPLPKIKLLSPGFSMINLLGESNKTFCVDKNIEDAKIYWYGKHETRSGRKMGHLNMLGSSSDAALKKGLRIFNKMNS